MQRLGQQTTKLLIATVYPLFYLDLHIRLNNIPENSSEPQCFATAVLGKTSVFNCNYNDYHK